MGRRAYERGTAGRRGNLVSSGGNITPVWELRELLRLC